MSIISFNFYIFIISAVFFVILAIIASRELTSPKSFFHNADFKLNIYSLTAGNITLGTGLLYLISGGQINGLLMFLIPLATWFGYSLLASFLKHVNITTRSGKNFLASVDKQISDETGSKSHFMIVVSIALIFIYILILAFEIYASSQFINPFLFRQPTMTSAVLLSGFIFFITIFYTLLGGIKAVFRTDKFQLAFMTIFLLALVGIIGVWFCKSGIPVNKVNLMFKLTPKVLFGTISASILAVTTQFYNLLNWGAASQVEVSQQECLFKKTGVLIAVILSVFVLIGVLNSVQPSENALGILQGLFSQIVAQSGFIFYVLSSILILGLVAILFSTVDSLIIYITMFSYDNLINKNSMSEDTNPKGLNLIRLFGFFALLICFIILSLLNYIKPEIFNTLLSIAGGVVVFAPMIAVAGYLTSRKNGLKVFSNLIVYSYLVLFILALFVSLYVLKSSPKILMIIPFISFFISAFLSVCLVLRSRKYISNPE
ncbi:MAG: hypothetical protein WBB67_11820 [bacterium]